VTFTSISKPSSRGCSSSGVPFVAANQPLPSFRDRDKQKDKPCRATPIIHLYHSGAIDKITSWAGLEPRSEAARELAKSSDSAKLWHQGELPQS
jgi:hypothetical protein